MGEPNRSQGPKPGQRLEREERAWDLSARGYSVREIAAQMSAEGTTISKSLVQLDLNRAAARHSKEFAGRIDEYKAEVAARLELVRREAMRAWQRSQEASKVVRAVRNPPPPGQAPVPGQPAPPPDQRVTTEVRDSDGDPRYLHAAMTADEHLRKLWGLDAPARTDVTSGGRRIQALGYRIQEPAGRPAGIGSGGNGDGEHDSGGDG